jgi:hypothetical protein
MSAGVRCAVLVLAALLGACAGIQRTDGQDAPPATARVDARASTTPRAQAQAAQLTALEAAQRALAQRAERAGDWLQAAWHWDTVWALRPADASAAQARDAALARAASAADSAVQAARRAQQRGDLDLAQRHFLEALAQAPEQAEAAQGLRTLERERVARQHLGKLSAQTLTQRETAGALMAPLASDRSRGSAAGPAQANELEHASLLAEQGELAAAIQLLAPLVAATPPNAAARTLMAELQFRKALALERSERAAARQAAAEAVRLNPARQDARLLLRKLSQPERGLAPP